MDAIRIFIGTEPKTKIMCQVLRHSILSRTSSPVEFVDMAGPEWEYPTDGIKVGTGFSLRRFMVPAACQWIGKAVYLDADMVCFADISEMLAPSHASPYQGETAIMAYRPDKFSKKPWPQSSAMVINCDRAQGEWGWHLDKVLHHLRKRNTRDDYVKFQHFTWAKPQPGRLDPEFNSFNEYAENKTKILHMTKEDTQPVYRPDLPISRVWEHEAVEAVKVGAVDRETIEDGLAKWKVKEDWRSTNGLHPYWKKLLDYIP